MAKNYLFLRALVGSGGHGLFGVPVAAHKILEFGGNHIGKNPVQLQRIGAGTGSVGRGMAPVIIIF